jgi:hypothetical protein
MPENHRQDEIFHMALDVKEALIDIEVEGLLFRPKKLCGFPVSSYKNLGRVGWF